MLYSLLLFGPVLDEALHQRRAWFVWLLLFFKLTVKVFVVKMVYVANYEVGADLHA